MGLYRHNEKENGKYYSGFGVWGPLKWIEYGFGYIANKIHVPIFYLLKEDCSIDVKESLDYVKKEKTQEISFLSRCRGETFARTCLAMLVAHPYTVLQRPVDQRSKVYIIGIIQLVRRGGRSHG